MPTQQTIQIYVLLLIVQVLEFTPNLCQMIFRKEGQALLPAAYGQARYVWMGGILSEPRFLYMLALPTARIRRAFPRPSWSAGTSTDAPTSGEYRKENSDPSCREIDSGDSAAVVALLEEQGEAEAIYRVHIHKCCARAQCALAICDGEYIVV